MATPTLDGDAAQTPLSKKRSVLICLLRLDLRIHDNPLFHYAHVTAPPLQPNKNKNPHKRASYEQDLFSTADYLLPVFVFDEREIELSGLPGYVRQGPEARTPLCGFWKTGGFRARFISETVYDLRSRLRAAGSDLFIRFGRPEVVVQHLVDAFQKQGDEVEGVWMQKEMTYQETQVEDTIARSLEVLKVPLRFVHGKTLVHPDDLPFDIADTPDVYTPFRKRVETLEDHMVRPALTSPSRFKPIPARLPSIPDYSLDVSYEVDVDGLSLCVPENLEKTEGQVSFHDILRGLLRPLNDTALPYALEGSALLQQRHPESAFPLRGGESAALERLEWYFVRGKSADSSRWGVSDPPPVAHYKQTRNNLLGHEYSTKTSPFLAYGSLSARTIWEALNAHEEKFGGDQNTYWVRFELLWRDYFFFAAEKFGTLLFDLGGFEKLVDPPQAERKTQPGWWKTWSPDKDGADHPVTRLLEGRTGVPFIDANIIELRATGFMSNRGRQNVASFLSKDLGYDWRIGAEFFQSRLIDYDPTSNYGNWQYVAGVGNDPRASRQFNCIKQAKDFDSHGEFVRKWIPALRSLPGDYIHTPWLLDTEERRRYGLKTTSMDVTTDAYPEKPMFEDKTWQKHYDRKEGVGSKMYGNPQEKVKDGKVKRYKKNLASVRNAPQWQGGGARAPTSRVFSSTMAPNFLPSTPKQTYPYSHPPHNGLGPSVVGAGSGTHELGSASQGVRSSTDRERNSNLPLYGLRGGIVSSSASQMQRSGSPGKSSGAMTPPQPPQASSTASTPPWTASGRMGTRGFVGGVLGGTGSGSVMPATSLSVSSGRSSADGSSKADREASWRRGGGDSANGRVTLSTSSPSPLRGASSSSAQKDDHPAS